MSKRKKALSLSDEIRDAIAKTDLSAYELAQAAGVDRSVLSRFRTGKRTITLATADRLAEVLKLRITRA
jgi:plasmid maintenance system antidote protein VapI